jgi:hypothetical protein
MRRFRTLAAFALFALFSGVGAAPAAAASGSAPTIQGGFPPAIGATLTASPNPNAPTDSVGWEVCGTYRLGDPYTATPSASYTLSSADVGRPVCAVELASPSNLIDGISDGLAPPGLSASGAAVTEGETITLTPGVWGSGASAPADTWMSCPSGGACTAIAPAPAGGSYTVSRADVGASISVLETDSVSGASASTSTVPTGIVAATPPVDLTPPSISGTPQVGATLTALPGAWSNDPTGYTYQWQRCASGTCTAISAATGPTYVPVQADEGDALVVLVAGVIDPGAPYGSTGEPVLSYPVDIPAAPSPTPTPTPAPVTPPPVVQVTQPSAPTGAIGRLTATMQWTFRYAPRETQVVTLAVEGPALGSVIATRCRGSGCPFRVHRITVQGLKRCRMNGGKHCRAPRAIELAWEFHARRLGIGTVITVAISRRGDVGRYYRFAVRRRRGPAVRISCLAPGSVRPGRGCTAA